MLRSALHRLALSPLWYAAARPDQQRATMWAGASACMLVLLALCSPVMQLLEGQAWEATPLRRH